MRTTNDRTAWFIVVGIAAFRQLVVIVLAGGGIFLEIYELFGIPWDATGLTNVVGTTLGFTLLELPVLTLAAFLFFGRRKR